MLDPSSPKFSPQPSLIAVLLLFCIAGGGSLFLAFKTQSHQPTQVLQIIRDIPAHTLLNLTDVQQVETNSPPKNYVPTMSGAIGHVTQKPLRLGTTLTSSMLTRSLPIPKSWYILPLPSSLKPPVDLGETVTLMGTKEDTKVGTIISQRSIVIGFQDTAIIIALPPNEARVAATFLLEKRHLIILKQIK